MSRTHTTCLWLATAFALGLAATAHGVAPGIVVEVWVPNYEQFVKLQKDWLDEWSKTYAFRQ